MTPQDAAKIIDLPADATPEQLEARFLELRRKLEDKIAKAPTPGLQAKYRESLTEITTAIETLALASDSSSLPVLKREQGEGRGEKGNLPQPETTRSDPAPSSLRPSPPARRKSGREFVIVVLIALLVLGAGGWFIMKTRAENAEKARIAVEAKAEAERKAEEARLAAEARRKAEEEEMARVAATAQAEQERLERLAGTLRGELVEYKVAWEAAEREERIAERRLSELKSDLRSLRDPSAGQLAEAQARVAAQQAYYDWLSDTLARHPAKAARSKGEELLSARQVDEAQAAMADLKAALDKLETLIPERRSALVDIEGDLALSTDSDVAWTLTDAFGRTRSGKGSGQLDGLAVGAGRVQLSKSRWPVREEKFVIRPDHPAELAVPYRSHTLAVGSTPDGAEVRLSDGTALGVTPLSLEGFPPGPLPLILLKEGYYEQKLELALPTSEPDGPLLTLRAKPTGLVKPSRWVSPSRVTVETRNVLSGSINSIEHRVEEWDFAQLTSKTGWQQRTRKFIVNTHANQEFVPASGSVLVQRRQPDGKWTGEFTQGGLPDGTYNHSWTSNVSLVWLVELGYFDVWPTNEVPVGGSWPVKTEAFFSMMNLGDATGQVQGRLVSLESESEGDRAVVEFHYSYRKSGRTGQAVLKAEIDLTNCYVLRIEDRDSIRNLSSTLTATVTTR